jgi:hypothetical protein
MALAVLVAGLLAIYPEDHFDRVTKCTAGNFESLVQEKVDAGKTLFVRWIASEG